MKVSLLMALVWLQISVTESATTPGTSEGIDSLLQCPTDQDICSVASQCCIPGVDSYGWIAAAVGWSLWFLTLILYCVGKVMNLRPNEPKYLLA